MGPDLAFLACVEPGKLEDQTVLLCRSIREFGGAFRQAPIYLFQPRPGRRIGRLTLAALCEQGASLVDVALNLDFPDHGTLNKVFACAYAERTLDERTLVFLDSDTVVVAEPGDLDLPPDVDVALRPAHSTRLNSRGPDDPIDVYWSRVFPGPALDELPYIETELGSRARAYFSAGLIAVRGGAGIFGDWERNLRRLVTGGIVPEGALDRMDEIALVATVAPRFGRVRLLDMRYNYLIYRRSLMVPPLRCLRLDEIIHVHYRSAFHVPGFLRAAWPPLGGGEAMQWIERYLPLRPFMEAAGDVIETMSRPRE